MFGVPFFAKALSKVVADYGIKTNFNHNLVAIDGPAKTATFETTDSEGNKQRITKDVRHDSCHAAAKRAGFH